MKGFSLIELIIVIAIIAIMSFLTFWNVSDYSNLRQKNLSANVLLTQLQELRSMALNNSVGGGASDAFCFSFDKENSSYLTYADVNANYAFDTADVVLKNYNLQGKLIFKTNTQDFCFAKKKMDLVCSNSLCAQDKIISLGYLEKDQLKTYSQYRIYGASGFYKNEK